MTDNYFFMMYTLSIFSICTLALLGVFAMFRVRSHLDSLQDEIDTLKRLVLPNELDSLRRLVLPDER